MERIFLDANVVLDGLVSRWSASRAVLILCAVRALRRAEHAADNQ